MLPLDVFISLKIKGGKLFVEGEEVHNAIKKNKFSVDFLVG